MFPIFKCFSSLSCLTSNLTGGPHMWEGFEKSKSKQTDEASKYVGGGRGDLFLNDFF